MAREPKDPRAGVRSTGGRGRFLTQLGEGYGVSQCLCWPASGQGQGPAGYRAGSLLLWASSVHMLLDCGFLASVACPLVGQVQSWPSAGQGHVKRQV